MGTRIEEIIKECDINGDGQIQWDLSGGFNC